MINRLHLFWLTGLLLFLSSFHNLFAQQQFRQYTVRFAPEVEALPSLADLDSLKQIAAIAAKTDTQTVIIRRYIDYWMRNDNYYVLLRKRSFLLQSIFERAGIAKGRLVIESQPLDDPDTAATMRNRIDVLVATNYVPSALTDTLTEEVPEVNYYSESRELLWQLIDGKGQLFFINPWSDTILYTRNGAALKLDSGIFKIPPTILELELYCTEAYQKSELLPYQLCNEEEKAMLNDWGGLIYLSAKADGKEVSLRDKKEILLLLPTDELHTDMRLYQSKKHPRQSMQWSRLETGFWEPVFPLCLPFSEAELPNFTYYCSRLQLAKPVVPVFPEKPAKPTLETLPKAKVAELDSAIALYDRIMNSIQAEYEEKTGSRLSKRKRNNMEIQYQRELENTLRKKKQAEAIKKKEQAAIAEINAGRMAIYQNSFDKYNQRRDSLQQWYLHAVRDWHIARDSLQWLCDYERYQMSFLRERYGDSLLIALQKGLRATTRPDLKSPLAKPLFPLGKQYYIIPTRKLGWLSLQRAHRYPENELDYKIFTYDDLPSYKVTTMAVLRNSRAAVAGKAEDMINLSFHPVPEEDQLWIFAMYLEDGKPVVSLQSARANKLPLRLEFNKYEDAEALEQALKRVNE